MPDEPVFCTHCRVRPPAPEHAFCQQCLDEHHRRQEQHRFWAMARLNKDCPRFTTANWKNYLVDDHNRDVYEAAGKWHFDEEYDHLDGGVYLWGPCGTGKSRLAYLIAMQCVEGGWDETARFVVVRNLLAKARSAMTRGEPNPIDELMAEDISLLVLDDLGAERCTDWARDTIATIVEARYMAAYYPTIVTTNYSPADLAVRLGNDDVLQGQRIVSRLLESTLVLKLAGPDRRLLKNAA